MFSILAVAIVLAKLVAGITINITSPSVCVPQTSLSVILLDCSPTALNSTTVLVASSGLTCNSLMPTLI
jgi:hypothetical protein